MHINTLTKTHKTLKKCCYWRKHLPYPCLVSLETQNRGNKQNMRLFLIYCLSSFLNDKNIWETIGWEVFHFSIQSQIKHPLLSKHVVLNAPNSYSGIIFSLEVLLELIMTDIAWIILFYVENNRLCTIEIKILLSLLIKTYLVSKYFRFNLWQ